MQRPIPIWIGAGRSTSPTPPNAAIRRIGRLADGYFPMFAPDSNGQAILGRIRAQAEAAGRDPSEVGFEGRITVTSDNNPEDWLTELKSWEEIGRNAHRGGAAWRILTGRSHRRHPQAERSAGVTSPGFYGWGMERITEG